MTNNNPLNLRRSGWIWQGLTPRQTDREYYQFRNPAYGYRAGFITLRNLIWHRGRNTLAKLLKEWAPDADGRDCQLYTARVCALTGMTPHTLIDPLDANQMVPLVAAISRIEQGRVAPMLDLLAGWRMYQG